MLVLAISRPCSKPSLRLPRPIFADNLVKRRYSTQWSGGWPRPRKIAALIIWLVRPQITMSFSVHETIANRLLSSSGWSLLQVLRSPWRSVLSRPGMPRGSTRAIRTRSGVGTFRPWHAHIIRQDLAYSIVFAGKRAREILVLLPPLIWLDLQRTGSGGLRCDPVPPTKIVAGVPLYAFDTHTRIGKRAIERLISENKPLRDCIVQFLARGSPRKAAEIAAFYADGAPVSRRLDWAQSDALERLGMEADFTAAGLRLEGIAPVHEAMTGALDQLNDIRAELWTAALVPGSER